MNIGIYGLGRFGAFWASALAKKQPVAGYNRSPLSEPPQGVRLVPLDELLCCDTIILCVAISAFRQVVESIAPHLRPGTLVMDTCSVKTYPAAIMERFLPPSVKIVATHPMFGPDSGKNGVAGLPLVFSPIRCDALTSDRWRQLFTDMGLHVIDMGCDQHDREAAYSQGVTHFVGRVLDELHLEPTELATLGYQRLMSIVEQTCNDPMQLFYDLQRYNPYAHAMHGKLKHALDSVLSVLEAQDIVGQERK
ncbi:MAG: prephenate dehydrogenase/arogenate dehydrogenase family protein [Sphaerochaetaceae bacterium]